MAAGAKKAFQPVATRSRPDSLYVGMSLANCERLAPELARMRILPPSCCGSRVSKVSKATGSWPPMRSLISGAEPR